MRKVLIGIQARSGSTRLPDKARVLIAGMTMLDRVIENCRIAAPHIQRRTQSTVEIVVLTPKGDPIVEEFSDRVEVIEGPEHDVLSRYKVAVDKKCPDYIVRITADCPMIPSVNITNLTDLAVNKGYDYISNSDERFRTSIDGEDCEVISRRLFETVAEIAVKPYDREHVTPLIRRSPPDWAIIGLSLNYFDLSDIKLSVDTQEDLDRVRKAFDSAALKYAEAARFYGSKRVHRR